MHYLRNIEIKIKTKIKQTRRPFFNLTVTGTNISLSNDFAFYPPALLNGFASYYGKVGKSNPTNDLMMRVSHYDSVIS